MKMSNKAYLGIMFTLVLIFVVSIPFLIQHFNSSSREIAELSAKEDAHRMANALKVMRKNYTQHVVKNAKSQLNITHDFLDPKWQAVNSENGKKGAIPLPATLTMEVAKGLSDEQTQVNLYSEYPFPWRGDRKLTKFQKDAFKFFEKNHDGTTETTLEYYEFDDEENVIKYAIPDLMVSTGCVNCHNTRAGTPKADWKLGDVRGAISIVKPMETNDMLAANTLQTYGLLAIMVLPIIGILGLILWKQRNTKKDIGSLANNLDNLRAGNSDITPFAAETADMVQLSSSVSDLSAYLGSATSFSTQIGEGNFNSEFESKSEQDQLGKSLIEMRDNLQKSAEEDQKRNWTTEGLAKFGEILRTSDNNFEALSYNVISNLIGYIGAIQGAIFILNEDQNPQVMEMKAAYAYDRQKHMEKTCEKGVGLVGECWVEKKSKLMDKLPENYSKITSGIGEADPKTIFITPLVINDQIEGILEIASLESFEEHHIDFINRLAESIAATIASLKTSIRTASLLEESRAMQENLKTQEEEMRQNMEEMRATQEAQEEQTARMQKTIDELNAEITRLKKGNE